MGAFSAAVLTKLGGEFATGTISRLKLQITGPPAYQALEHCLQVGLVALMAQATAAEPEAEVELAAVFNKFFHDPDVWTEIARLVQDKPLDHDRLMEYFIEAGYDPDTLPNLNFNRALNAFAAAYVNAAEWQPALHGVILTARARQQLSESRELLATTKELVTLLSEKAAVSVRAGAVVDEASGRTIWNVAGDQVYGTKIDMPGDFRGATIHIVNNYREAPGEPLWNEEHFRGALERYLKWVAERYGRPQLRGVEKRERELPPITLEKVYVSLNAFRDSAWLDEEKQRHKYEQALYEIELSDYGNAGRADQESVWLDMEGLRPGFEKELHISGLAEESRGEPVDMATLLRDNSRLVITGAPGCGKTTFLYVIASTLARGMLTGQTEAAQNLIGLPAPLPLPVYFSLGDYNRYRISPNIAADPEHGTLLAYARYALIRQLGGLRLPRDFFERLLTGGQACVFLLDGLDEVVEERHRQIVSGDVENLSYIEDLGHIVVTSRTRAYVGESKLPATFRRAEVQPMTLKQVNELARRWCHAVYDEVDALNETNQLQAEIAQLEEHRLARGEQRRLVDTPLLVTIIAIVHYNDKHLPEQRAALYKSCIHVLLADTHHTKGETRHELEDWGGSEEDKRELLTLIAFNMMSAGEKAGRTVDERTIKMWLRPRVLRRRDEAEAEKTLRDFLQAMAERSSLLNERDRVYEFIHLTFQEYLCATYLAHELPDARAIVDFLTSHVGDSWWRETIMLTPGHLSTDNRTAALKLIEELSRLSGRDETALAAAELAGSAYLELNFSDRPTGDTVAQRLADLLTDETLTVPNSLRGRADIALSRLGDPRPGVGVIEADGLRLPDITWGKIVPAGLYTIGGDVRAYAGFKPRHVTIAHPFQLARYPVTYSQFNSFLTAPDFDDQRWWGGMRPEGENYDRPNHLRELRGLSEQTFPYANHPFEQVSWYQAVAFCRWLSDKLGYTLELPHEYEWEIAARYPDGRFYPWGNDFDPARANTFEGGIGTTSAVGIFPLGANPALGLYDLSGNVWEWCRNKFDEPEDDAVYPSGARRVLRGGSWGNGQDAARAVSRGSLPYYRNFSVGCRLMRRPPSQAL